MKYRQLIINGNKVTSIALKYNVRFKMNLAGVTIYYSSSDNTGQWFPLANCEKAIPLILKIANIKNENQSTLDSYL